MAFCLSPLQTMSVPRPKKPIVRDIDDSSDEELVDSASSEENIEDTRMRLAAELHTLTDYTGICTTRARQDLFDEEIDVRQSVANATAEAARLRYEWASERLEICQKQANTLFSHHSYLNKDAGFLGLNIREMLHEAVNLQQQVKASNEYDKQLMQRYYKQIDLLEKGIKATEDLLGVGTTLVKAFAHKTIGPKIEGDEKEKTKKIDDFATGLTSLFFHIVSFAYNSKTQAK
uniref:Uncharacterized protein n=1 Tax=Clandestinovirus TaxID=2831644 RepID=A0A8F8KLR3_9VIRU|nr:hypothetical protein KOM_12_451 [Clandestinovirus]